MKNLFFNQIDINKTKNIIKEALWKSDDGELYLEQVHNEMIILDDGIIKNTSFNTRQGFGLRAISGDSIGYAHSSGITDLAFKKAALSVKQSLKGFSGIKKIICTNKNNINSLYTDRNPINSMEFSDKVKFMYDVDSYTRKKDQFIQQVSVRLGGFWQLVSIIDIEGRVTVDIRPLVSFSVFVVVGDSKNNRGEGFYSVGGRTTYDIFFEKSSWKNIVDKAVKSALVNMTANDTPAGEMPVVLGPGWTGVLLHEAIGHGLEGDFNRKKTSVFSDLLGKRIATPGVTIVDDGTIKNRRGSLTIDDEGTPSQRTVLVENGILRQYIQDRHNARLMGIKSTGNGRRESYENFPIPRMTNTIMLNGNHSPEEIIHNVKYGLYVKNLKGGQVDITSGKFVFEVSDAYLIEKGQITSPVKGAMLIGSGVEVLNKIKMIGNDMQLDPGVGTCGKEGQGVPVGVGQPTLLVSNLTVGGTQN